tara:strand:+ start:6039 stop:6284 length:246 start_codon:yes stop_codon:yes gene_type:complete
MQISNGIVRLNKLAIRVDSVEAMEWQEVFEEEDTYQIRFHTNSGKLYTRRGPKEIVKQLISILQDTETTYTSSIKEINEEE